MTSPIFNAAVEIPALRALGLNVLPARLAEKRPIGFWKRYCDQFATGSFGFDEADALCVVCGATSGNLEIIDFDFGAVAFDDFCALAAENGLFDVVRSCLQERTQSGGKHLIYRVDAPVEGNRKLARRDFGASVAVGPDVREITVGGKKIARGKDGRFVGTTIETRGAGGICLVSPSPGYSLERGAWDALPVLTREERDALFEVAQLCDNYRDGAAGRSGPALPREAASAPVGRDGSAQLRLGSRENVGGAPTARSAAYSSYSGRDVADELRERGVVRESLLADGWTLVGSDARKEYWRRPGKRDGVSASLDLETEMFYCWSTNAPPFEAERTYTPLQFVAARDFDDDLSAASKNWKERFDDETAQTAEPATLAFALGNSSSDETSDAAPSKTPPQFPAPVPNGATPNASERRDADRETPDEVPFPPELFECGGLLEEVQRFTNANSIRFQPELAFAGALALVSFLIGRKLTSDRGATTPNLYVVGLGGASSGKNAARETNAKLLSAVDLGGCVVERFESAQALQNMICAQKKILLQQDEFGQELQTTTLNAGPNRFLIVSEMLKLFSNAKSPYYSPRVVAADFIPEQDRAGIYFSDLFGGQLVYRILRVHQEHEGVIAYRYHHQVRVRGFRGGAFVGVGPGTDHDIDGVRLVHHGVRGKDRDHRIREAARQTVIGIRRGGEVYETVQVFFRQFQPLPSQFHCHGDADCGTVNRRVTAPVAQGYAFCPFERGLGPELEIIRFTHIVLPSLRPGDGLVDLSP